MLLQRGHHHHDLALRATQHRRRPRAQGGAARVSTHLGHRHRLLHHPLLRRARLDALRGPTRGALQPPGGLGQRRPGSAQHLPRLRSALAHRLGRGRTRAEAWRLGRGGGGEGAGWHDRGRLRPGERGGRGAERRRGRKRRGDGRRGCGPGRVKPRVLLAVPPHHDPVQRIHGDATHQLGRLGGRRADAPLQPRRRIGLGAGRRQLDVLGTLPVDARRAVPLQAPARLRGRLRPILKTNALALVIV
mmetsp:Transcript_59833/g.143762  ORF Transcript_59833/g.143762 Transcript_59833/m.143762 type:complete len:246 (+) Transcript_59833:841-1578(+)